MSAWFNRLRRTPTCDGRTHDGSIYCAIIASRGKNGCCNHSGRHVISGQCVCVCVCVCVGEDTRQAGSCSASVADAAEDIVSSGGLSPMSSTATNVRQLPTRLTDTSFPELPPSPTCMPAHSRRVRPSASDTGGAHLLSSPTSYRASFSRLQPVDMPEVDICRQRDVITHPIVSDTHKRSTSSRLFTVSRTANTAEHCCTNQ